MPYGLVASVPIGVLPAKNETDATEPSESLAVADTAIAAPATKDAPLAGALTLTEGALLATIVTATDAEVVVAPRLSVATAVSE